MSKRLAARFHPAVTPGVAFADEDEREMCERREVAARADRSARWHHWMHAAIEQLDEQLERLLADSGVPLRQHVGAQRHRCTYRGHRQRIADAGGVTSQQVHLKL